MVEAETEVESEVLHESPVSEVFGIVAEMAVETAMNPPSPSVEEVETQRTEEDPQDEEEVDDATETINDEIGMDLAALVAEEVNPVSTIVRRLTRKFQSFLAKGPQVKHKT